MTQTSVRYTPYPGYRDADSDAPALTATVDLSTYGAKGIVNGLPVWRGAGAAGEIYTIWIAGLCLEAENLETLTSLIDRMLSALVRMGRLPRYLFNFGDSAWPIYQLQEELITRYPGGPVFTASNIADLWIALADHFKHIGRIASRRDLEILFFSWSDLQIYAPEFSLRFPSAADIPIFSIVNGHGPELIAPVGRRTLRLPINGGSEVWSMYRLIGDLLVQESQLGDLYDMSVRKLANDRWDSAVTNLTPIGQAVTYAVRENGGSTPQAAQVYSDGSGLVAMRQTRPDRVTVYLGRDLATLQARMGDEMFQRGEIDDPGAVRAGALPQAHMEMGLSRL